MEDDSDKDVHASPHRRSSVGRRKVKSKSYHVDEIYFLNQLQCLRLPDRTCPAVHIQLAIDILQMGLDGAFGE